MASKGEIFVDEIQPKKNNSWNYISFKDTLSKNGSFYKFKSKEYIEQGLFPIIDQGEKFISGYTNDENKIYKGDFPVIIFGDHTRNIKFIDFKFAIGADGTKILTPITQFDPKFFFYYLKSLQIPSFGYSRHYRVLNQIDFPLPPLEEQNRIVAKLDQLFAHLETAKKGLEKIPTLLKEFRQAVLTQAVTGKLTEEFNYYPALSEIKKEKLNFWETELELKKIKKIPLQKNILTVESVNKIEKLLSKKYDIANFDDISSTKPNALKAGPFGSSLKKEYYVSAGYKIYGQEQVIKDDPHFGDYYIDEERFSTLKSCEVDSGDILISLVGTIGKVLIIPENFEKGIINPRLVKLSLHKKINPNFIKLFLQSDFVINHLKDQSHGGTMDVLNLGILRELPIPIPSLEEQTEIVRRVETLFAKADAIEERYKNLKEKIEQLPQAILGKAFRGEL